MVVRMKVTVTGSMVGQARAINKRGEAAMPAVAIAVADQGLVRIRNETRVFKRPTGFYKSQLQVTFKQQEAVVNDNNVIYGPWLERGRTSTSFRGYQIWAKAFTQMLGDVDRITRGVLADHGLK